MRKFVITKKMIIASAATAAILITGASAATIVGMQHASEAAEESSAVSITDIASDTTANVETSSEITAEASTKVLGEASTSASLASTTRSSTITTKRTEAVTLAGEKEVSLNITSQSDAGTLQFSKAKIDYDRGVIGLYFIAQSDHEFTMSSQSMSLNTGSKALRVHVGSLPTPVKQSDGTYKADNCYVSFAYIPDGSPVTFSYAFTGHDTQSVQITIPGV